MMCVPPLYLHQPRMTIQQLSELGEGGMNLPVLCHWRAGLQCQLLLHVQSALPLNTKAIPKGEIYFCRTSYPCLFFFFPPAFTLKTFYLTKSQNDRSAFLIHFLCTVLLAQHIPATSPCVNSLLNYSDQGF